jgi:hypothetical protein
MDVRDALRGAKEVLLNEGWCKYELVEMDGDQPRYCISGAIGLTVGGMTRDGSMPDRTNKKDWDQAMAYLNATLQVEGSYTPSAVEFNDEVAEDVDDVVALIDRALLRLEAPDWRLCSEHNIVHHESARCAVCMMDEELVDA